MFCTYVTLYRGNRLPPFYIGSARISAIRNGYHGSVKSRKYRSIFEHELQSNPHLFKTRIISEHSARSDALIKEKQLQRSLNVVKSPMYINMSFAQTRGRAGGFEGKKHTPETIAKMSHPKRDTSRMKGSKSESHRRNISAAISRRKWFNDGIKNYFTEPKNATGLNRGIINRKRRTLKR